VCFEQTLKDSCTKTKKGKAILSAKLVHFAKKSETIGVPSVSDLIGYIFAGTDGNMHDD
jgi:hypothetical protein